MSKVEEEFVAWNPDWSPEEREEIERAKALIRRNTPVLRELRQTFGLTQVDVANLLGITQATVSKMEGRGDPRLSVVRELVRQQGGTLKLVAKLKGRELEIEL